MIGMSAPNPQQLTIHVHITGLILLGMILFFTLTPPEIVRSAPNRQQPTHDLAITNVQAAVSSVSQGEVVKIDITVANLGTNQETFEIKLHDETDGKEVDSVGVTVEPGQILDLTFSWDTSGASAGVHSLKATAELAGDENPDNNGLGPASPITVILVAILLGDGSGGGLPDASFGAGLIPPDTSTAPIPNTEVFLGNHDASLSSSLNLVNLGTLPAGLGSFFLANTDAAFSPEVPLRNPFLQGQLRGLTHLEGRPNGLGALVQVGDVAHPVEQDGRFNLLLPEGIYDISIWAPGYIAVNMPNVEIISSQVVNVPELTLPFGDANGDGRIDILDLSMAGATSAPRFRSWSCLNNSATLNNYLKMSPRAKRGV